MARHTKRVDGPRWGSALITLALAPVVGLTLAVTGPSDQQRCEIDGNVWVAATLKHPAQCRIAGAEAGGVVLDDAELAALGANSSGNLGNWRAMGSFRSSAASFRVAMRGAWIYGDSITMMSRAHLTTQLGLRGVPTAVDAWSGRPSTPAIDQLATDIAKFGAPRVVILAVGTNDIFEPSVMRTQARRALNLVPKTTRVVWVNVSAQRPKWAAADKVNAAAVNAAIATAAAGRSNVRVVGWRAFIDAKPGRSSYYLKDGVHPSSAGVSARSALILRTLGYATR